MEVGENGTPHLQGYIEFDKPKRMKATCKLLGGRAYVTMRAKTIGKTEQWNRDKAREYCMKEGEWLEFGEWSAGGRGARTDLQKLMELINNTEPTIKIMEEMPAVYSKNIRFCEKYQALKEKQQTKQFRKQNVIVLYGKSGTGKSSYAIKNSPDLFHVNPEDSFPFDGYDGESSILIDDFEGQLKYKHLLKILDGHQLRINVKGSHRYAKWNTVYITCTRRPEDWYQRGLTPELARRISEIHNFYDFEKKYIEEGPYKAKPCNPKDANGIPIIDTLLCNDAGGNNENLRNLSETPAIFPSENLIINEFPEELIKILKDNDLETIEKIEFLLENL